MKIWYALNAVGNGHITRGRVMAAAFNKLGLDVTYMFSGRPADKFFDMDIFGDYQVRKGLTFNIDKGKVNLVKTVLEADITTLINDVKELDLSEYDVIISDYEPITAWAGKLQKKVVIGLGHQYAFNHNIPKTGNNPITDLVMKYFAPTAVGIGLHWNNFGQPILPPIIDLEVIPCIVQQNKYVVYLPFEDQGAVYDLLFKFPDNKFAIYSPDNKSVFNIGNNITCKPLSRAGFQQDVNTSVGVICNAGFELASEALYHGKKLLVKPVHSQMEQASNALAIDRLNYGSTMNTLDYGILSGWLEERSNVSIRFPNVAEILASYIKKHGNLNLSPAFYMLIWRRAKVTRG